MTHKDAANEEDFEMGDYPWSNEELAERVAQEKRTMLGLEGELRAAEEYLSELEGEVERRAKVGTP